MNAPVILDRRHVLKGGGSLIITFSLTRAFAQDQTVPAAAAPSPPGSLKSSPYLDSWIRIDADGAITVFTGKAELGQGFKTAFQQIAAEELNVPFASLKVVTADTKLTANEGYTSGSHSMQDSGTAIQNAAAQARELLLAEAAKRLDVSIDNLQSEDGVVIAPDGRRLSYGELVSGDMLHVQAQPSSKLKDPSTLKVMGQSIPRVDIPAKVTGGVAYVQDLRLSGMVHARVVRPPSYGAQLIDCDVAAIEKMPGVVKVVRDGNFLAVIAAKEFQAIKAMNALANAVAGFGHIPAQRSIYLRSADHRGHIYAPLSITRLCRAILRDCPICGWGDDSVVAHAGRLSGPSGHCRHAADAACEYPRDPCRGFRLLWPQRSRRCCGRCRNDRPCVAGRAGPRAMDARAGARLGALRAGHGHQAEGLTRCLGQNCRLEFRGFQQHAFDATGWRRLPVGGPAHGAARCGTACETHPAAGRWR
jgi:hypothetical protein